MEADDELCLCFHISWRKVINYLRIHKVKTASRVSECGGAGTGCGWCRKQLERLTITVQEIPPSAANLEAWLRDNSPSKQIYVSGREKYRAHQESDG